MPLLEAADPVPEEEPVEQPRLIADDEKRTIDALNQVGALSEQVGFGGHTFTIRTLTTDERLIVGLLTKDYQDTMAGNMAYVTAWVALAVQRANGDLLPFPFEENGVGHEWAILRFNYVKSRWYKFTIDFLYSKAMELEAEVEKALAEMAKTSG